VSELITVSSGQNAIAEIPIRIPLRRLPNNRIASTEMLVDLVGARSYLSAKETGEQFMQRVAEMFARQLRIPREQVDLIQSSHPADPIGTVRFWVLAHMKDDRVKTESDALAFYRNAAPREVPIPDFIDV
jgi:hypothetical protein